MLEAAPRIQTSGDPKLFDNFVRMQKSLNTYIERYA